MDIFLTYLFYFNTIGLSLEKQIAKPRALFYEKNCQNITGNQKSKVCIKICFRSSICYLDIARLSIFYFLKRQAAKAITVNIFKNSSRLDQQSNSKNTYDSEMIITEIKTLSCTLLLIFVLSSGFTGKANSAQTQLSGGPD